MERVIVSVKGSDLLRLVEAGVDRVETPFGVLEYMALWDGAMEGVVRGQLIRLELDETIDILD